MADIISYRDWRAMNCTENAEKANEILEEKISKLLEKNGYKNDYGPGQFHIRGSNTSNYGDIGLDVDVTVTPICGMIAEVKIGKENYSSEWKEQIVRIHESEAFYVEDYKLLCDIPTRLAYAVLSVVNHTFGKNMEKPYGC